MTPRSWACALLLAVIAPAGGHAIAVEAIPTPRPGGWSVDLTGTLRAEDLAALDRLGNEVKAQTGAELAVAVVGSTDGAPHRAFATDLANRWGIGDAAKDNGVLVFAALDDRAAEIVLGDGIDGPEQVRAAEEIMQGEMVPRFRAGDAGGAVFYGALACAQRILGATPTAAGMPSEGEPGAPPPAMPLQGAPPDAASPPATPDVPPPVAGMRGFGPRMLLLAVSVGLALLGGGYFVARHRPRLCRSCQTPMVRLDEVADDAHLGVAEKVEERIGSVSYDVWSCPSCGNAEKRGRGAFLTRYTRCAECGARTAASSSQILEAATTSRSSSSRSRSSGGGGRSSGRGASGRW